MYDAASPLFSTLSYISPPTNRHGSTLLWPGLARSIVPLIIRQQTPHRIPLPTFPVPRTCLRQFPCLVMLHRHRLPWTVFSFLLSTRQSWRHNYLTILR